MTILASDGAGIVVKVLVGVWQPKVSRLLLLYNKNKNKNSKASLCKTKM